jgi:hypothetical protein
LGNCDFGTRAGAPTGHIGVRPDRERGQKNRDEKNRHQTAIKNIFNSAQNIPSNFPMKKSGFNRHHES